MKAMITTAYGTPEIFKFDEVAKPTVKTNEVRVRVYAASVTKADTMMRTGKPYIGRLFTGIIKPKNAIWGTCFAGEVDAVGAGVTQFKPGDKVFGENTATFGTYAEYMTIPEDGLLAKMPHALDYETAAAIVDGGITSLNFLQNVGEIKAGQRVLINGASGSLGSAAVQIAKYYGAEVTGVCSSRNVAFVSSLGADAVIDYTQEDFTTSGQNYDVIYDTVGARSFSECREVLSEHGRYICPVLGMPLFKDMIATAVSGSKKAKFAATGALPKKELKRLFAELVTVIEAGHISPYVDRSYPLDELVEAHRYVDTGHKRGNVVVRPAA